jgi:hypothetical protein
LNIFQFEQLCYLNGFPIWTLSYLRGFQK